MAAVDAMKHEDIGNGQVRVTVMALGDTCESVVPRGITPCSARVKRSPRGDWYISILDRHGELVVASRVFTAVLAGVR